MTRKPWYKSRTVWFNGITVAVYILGNMQGAAWMNKDVLVGVLAVGNGILRWMTDKGIK